MREIQDLTQRLASSIVMADPTDLPALADMHEQFQQLGKMATSSAFEGDGLTLSEIAGVGEKLIEKIILREAQDIKECLQQVGQAINEMQRILDGGAPAPAATAASTSTATTPATEASTTSTTSTTSSTASASDVVLEAKAVPAPQATAPAAPVAQPAPAKAEAHDEHCDVPEVEPVPSADDMPMVLEFISEATGHIEMAEAAVLKIEEDPQNFDAINEVFRCFHTIKGVAGFLNLQRIGKLSHAAENLLDMARHGTIRLEGGLIDAVLESIDSIKRMILGLNETAKTGKPAQPDPLLKDLIIKLNGLASGKHDAAPAPAQAVQEQTASPEAAKETVKEVAKSEPAPSTSTSTPASTPASKPSAEAPASAPQAEAPKAASGGHAGSGDTTVKVATDRLDSLINMVGELVIAQSMVSQDMLVTARGNQRIERNVSHLSKITRELQDLSMSMRMVPIQGVFQKMSRLVRDLARKNGKDIELILTGSETELDRNVVEAISDPLVHMVRNAADHGVEMPSDREAAGKPRTGRIELRAYHMSGNIVIEIRDDGKGLKKERILAKAIAAGIVRESDNLTDQDIFKLIFAPGLSTAEKVTDVSGRGVGMDVVKRNVEALRGRIEIESAEGKGSIFTIRLPLTLAVIDGQIVRVGNQRYIVPITTIEQSIQPKSEQLSTVQNRGELCMVRGDLLPLFRLYRMFNVQPTSDDPTKALVVIVQDGTRRCCLLVDELMGQQQVVIKSLGDSLGNIPGISGGAILGDGNVSLILDIPGLITMASR